MSTKEYVLSKINGDFPRTYQLEDGMYYYGSSLSLWSSLISRVYVSAIDDSVVQTYLDDDDLYKDEEYGLYYTSAEWYSVTEWGEEQELLIGSTKISYTPLQYIYMVLEKDYYPDVLQDLCIALYDYYEAAMNCYSTQN